MMCPFSGEPCKEKDLSEEASHHCRACQGLARCVCGDELIIEVEYQVALWRETLT